MRFNAQMNQSVQTNFSGKRIKLHKNYQKIKCDNFITTRKEFSCHDSYKYGAAIIHTNIQPSPVLAGIAHSGGLRMWTHPPIVAWHFRRGHLGGAVVGTSGLLDRPSLVESAAKSSTYIHSSGLLFNGHPPFRDAAICHAHYQATNRIRYKLEYRDLGRRGGRCRGGRASGSNTQHGLDSLDARQAHCT